MTQNHQQHEHLNEDPPTPWRYKTTDRGLAKVASQLRDEQTQMLNGRLPANKFALDAIANAIGSLEVLRMWRLAFNARHMAQELQDRQGGDV